MVYAYDLWLQMPTKDLFDTLMMLASVNAAKDMYEKGLEEMKEFNEKYGDFLSPIESDMQWHQENVIGKVSNAINALYDAGIDPVRSKEGRGLLSRIRANINYGRIALNVQAAKNAEQYLKSINDLIKSNLYDPEYEKWRLGGKTLSTWNTAKDGMWTETSARPFRDVDSIVEPWVKNLEPSYDAAYTKAQNDGYDYDTVSKERIMAVIDDALPEFTRTSEGAYYRYLAELAAGGDKKAGDALLKEWLYNRASDHTLVNRTINPERKMALEDYYDKIQTQRQANKEIEVHLQKKIIDGKFGGGGDKNVPSIFREADENLKNLYLQTSIYNAKGQDVGYDRFEYDYYQWIDPIGEGIRADKNLNLGFVYWIPKKSLNTVYISDSKFGRDKKAITNTTMSTNEDRYFVPVGRMHAEKDKGLYRYFITGTLTSGSKKDENGNYEFVTNPDGQGLQLFDLEVTERAFNYGKKQLGATVPSN